MADPRLSYGLDEKHSDADSLEKRLSSSIDDAEELKEVEELEKRLENDEATPEEFRVEEAHEVAIKVLSTRDDPTLSAVTFRTVFLGLGFSAFGAVLAQIYYFKPQTLSVSTLFLLVISYWFGNGMHYGLPSHGLWKWINPGPFNIKEHVAIIIMSSTAATSATAIQMISVQELYYNNDMNAGIAIFTLISSQLLGYGYAGLVYDLVVKPTRAFWPGSIATANLFQALHYDNQMTSKRVRLFWTIFAAMFCWEIFPEWIFPVLTGISVFCLADNHSATFRNVFGGASNNEGMGLLALCLDWNYIGSGGLYLPFWYQINMNIGIACCYILMTTLWYGNAWDSHQFPFMSQAIFAEDGSQYNQTALLTNGRFDATKYAQLGPAFFSSSQALSLTVTNISFAACLSHVALWHWQDLRPFLASFNPWNKNVYHIHDPHFEKMKVYKSIPRWWYLITLIGAFAIAQATNYTGKSGFPWWTLVIYMMISFIFFVALAVLNSTIGFNPDPTGLFQMITAYILPGKPVANMYGVLYGAHPTSQALLMAQDLKLGQYVKLAPRVTFCVQLVGTVVGALLNYVMMKSIINAQRPSLLSISGTRLWSGQNAQAYNTNAISWGALAPEMFSINSRYWIVPIGLAIGFFLPFPLYFLHRMFPKAGFHHINFSIIGWYCGYLVVGLNTSVNTAQFIGMFSQWWMRTRHPRWFTKYNYITAAALDGGTQVIVFVLNFAVFGASGNAHNFPQWWGNDFNLSADRCLAPAE